MLVSSQTNLIPYDQRHYPVQPFIPQNELVTQDVGRDSIERHNRFQPLRADKMTHAIHLDGYSNRYDSAQFLQYSDDDQVGFRVDLYA